MVVNARVGKRDRDGPSATLWANSSGSSIGSEGGSEGGSSQGGAVSRVRRGSEGYEVRPKRFDIAFARDEDEWPTGADGGGVGYLEDEEGELFWPGQLITGGGMGWVCLMGKAMLKEFGRELGYQGLEGIIPKPSGEDVSSMYASTPGFCPDPCDYPAPVQR